MKWLITCFEPFDRARSNSSQIVWNELRRREAPEKFKFYGPLKVTFKDSWAELEDVLKRESVDGVLALGQAESRSKISLECVGLNWIDARIPDNAGEKPAVQAILEGPNALWSNIPWLELGENEDWQRSYSAGTYVCNFLLFQISAWALKNKKFGGFVHLPLVESQREAQFDGQPKMNDERAIQAMSRILNQLCQLQPKPT